ncbi:hypothetical protein L3X38_006189 [Prunus dulcis]|uniref:Transposable element protein n=1 Tax=Prunus dulcis TaxID=3755 RepID=A0AAD5F4S6_PRUDU|nr:hypothetical protein L3X38_006189 [Prunus dulcis]
MAEKANIIGCNDQVASSAFKKGLPTEHKLYRELAITPSQTLAEVFSTAERYALWDDDRIAAKKASKQVDHPTKQASQKSNQFEQRARDNRRSRLQEESSKIGTFTEFAIPIHQILAQVKDKPWELVRRGHCTEFVAKKVIQQIEDHDAAAKEPPQKVIRINTILAESQESGLTTKERKRKITQATYISQVTIGVPVIVDTPIISFQKKDLIGLDLPHNNALVICIQIEQAVIERIHVDEDSAANILQLSVIQQMGFEPKINKLASKIEAITSALHQKIRYPIPGGGIGQINSDQAMVRRCTAQGLKKSKQLPFTPKKERRLARARIQTRRIERRESARKALLKKVGSLRKTLRQFESSDIVIHDIDPIRYHRDVIHPIVPLDPNQPYKKARIGSRLSPDEKVELTIFLQNNKGMFAWSPSDMPGIDLNIICHRLHANPASKPVVQKIRNFAPERVVIIEAEIDKLLAAGFIEEVSYSEWLPNVVLVAKQEKGKWRVCVDYTDLNKACPKDNFPLSRIDQLVDSTSGNQLLSFMDAYSGYIQL